MTTSATLTAIKNQLQAGEAEPICFNKLNFQHGAGAVMRTVMQCPGLTQGELVSILHDIYSTVGRYAETFSRLQAAAVITATSAGLAITKLGLAVLREHKLL